MIPDGVYLNMPADVYRNDPALGSTDHKAILASAVQWHAKNRNKDLCAALELDQEKDPQKAAKKVAGKEYGSALDVMLLDGEDAFDAIYMDDPERPDDLPSTREEMAAALRARGLVPPGPNEKKDRFEAACMAVGITTAADWDEERSLLLMGRRPISKAWRRAITLTKRILDRHSGAQRYLTGGRPQVSVFWTDATGLRLKARFDYLLPTPTVDLKSYAMRPGKDPITAFMGAIEEFGYDMQFGHYMEARKEALPALVAEDRIYDWNVPEGAALAHPDDAEGPGPFVFANATDTDFMEKVAQTAPRWAWLTVMTGGVPEIDTIEMPMDLLQFSAARVQIEQARQTYRDFRAKFGPDDGEIWLADRGLVVLTDQMFSMRAANRGATLYDTVR